MKSFIKGTFKRYIFEGKNGFTIGLLKVKETNDKEMEDEINNQITFTGYFPKLNEDENYIMYGSKVIHNKYGMQYEVKEFERLMPEDKEGLIEFLSSDLFKGIGEKQASVIVDELGNDALDRILKDYKCIINIKGMNEKKGKKLYDALLEYNSSHKTIVELCNKGFSMKESIDVYNYYKDETENIINNNPYKIYYEIKGINFQKIDNVFLKENGLNDKTRIEAGIIYTLKEVAWTTGDTYQEYEELKEKTCFLLKLDYIEEQEFNNCISSLIEKNLLIKEENNFLLRELFDAEEYIKNKIFDLLSFENKSKNLENEINNLEDENNIEYSLKQRQAIEKSLNNNILVITGGPGTGKTTIIKAIVELYKKTNKLSDEKLIEKIALLAPTGRAAKRISGETLYPAYTIHRYLKWNKETDEFAYNEENKTESEFIIIDESSMIDLPLLYNLFLALKKDVRIIFIGDIDQLPSVGPGQILKDIITSDIVETVYLDLLYRQSEYSTIINLANDIKDSELNTDLDVKREDFSFIETNEQNILKATEDTCKIAISKGKTEKDIQVLVPMYMGMNGIDNLNKKLQAIFNPKEEREVIFGDKKYKVNDKVLQLVNMPDDDVYNGDIGYITNILNKGELDNKTKEVHIDFDGNIVKYKQRDFINFTHGFAISIHKAQGSEFDTIIMPLAMSYKRMLDKKIIYTGITRAKEKLILIGEKQALAYGIRNDRYNKRKSLLKDRLINEINNQNTLE